MSYTSLGRYYMVSDMNSRILIAALAFGLPGLAVAQATTSYQCSLGELQRRVEILTEPGVSVPCEVHYYKDTEAPGDRQVLWSASAEEGYCERKAQEFVAKLESWGWACSAGGAAPAPEGESMPAPEGESMPAPEGESMPAPDPKPEPALPPDDTEALAPVDEATSAT